MNSNSNFSFNQAIWINISITMANVLLHSILEPLPRKVRVVWADDFRRSLDCPLLNGYRRLPQMRLALWLLLFLRVSERYFWICMIGFRSQCRYLLTELAGSSADGASCCLCTSLSKTYPKKTISIWKYTTQKIVGHKIFSASASISLTKWLMSQTGSTPKRASNVT